MDMKVLQVVLLKRWVLLVKWKNIDLNVRLKWDKID